MSTPFGQAIVADWVKPLRTQRSRGPVAPTALPVRAEFGLGVLP
jgi:hypothetical protein